MPTPEESAPPSVAQDLPPPSPEIILIRVAISAYLSTNSKKKGDAFLKAMAEILRDETSLAAVVAIRGPAQADAVAKARRGAMALFRALLPTLLGRVER